MGVPEAEISPKGMDRIMRKKESLDLFSSCLREVQISYCNRVRYADMPKVSSSKDAENIFRSIWSHRLGYVEEFFVLLLNRSSKVIGWSKVSMGGQTACLATAVMCLSGNIPSLSISTTLNPAVLKIGLMQSMKQQDIV